CARGPTSYAMDYW
nr:immunoglobulin heavy chain junction region [Mus musculus]MBK4184635.1 immunoglobulin heavy chain junction region [Mus musculus]MBK4184636.1 immunoglobulin heavy chain junction region [Mus musculus]MBK4184637.1 immunoglobulin heavy chain junction region [Mus musculus]MBK4184638.1 immunoglobulin heavy chain junction region [Mus musculus]